MGTVTRFIRSYLVYRKGWGNMEMFLYLWVGRGKGQAVFSPLVLLRGSQGVGENWSGKTSRADQSNGSAQGGSEWKGCQTSAGA